MTNVHIINHTHWDREWFLTHEYTTAWVPALIDSIEELAAANHDYEFLLDGQALAIEDLLTLKPEYRERVRRLMTDGNLVIGPVYSQPDWRMTSGELHVRNLLHGLDDAADLGGAPSVAWLVDTFGHISQAPQLLRQAGIDAAYVWRGVPEMAPLFRWRGPDGTELTTIDLFGGYRNLYGITKTPDIAVHRLVAETDKLASSYGDLPVPLFDGYDLDTEPEDPVRYYADLDVPERVTVEASSPHRYAQAMQEFIGDAPVLHGELISGKYGSTFPGSLSSRSYLKILHHDAEVALHRYVEPLAALAHQFGRVYDGPAYEQADRTLLQNAVHDCICGVSIDQVHERMERSYRRMLDWADGEVDDASSAILQHFAPGTYAISTHAMATQSVIRSGDTSVEVATSGIGVAAVHRSAPVEAVNVESDSFEWHNDHYRAHVDDTGLHIDDIGNVLTLVVRVDDGDTYSSEPGAVLGTLAPVGRPKQLDKSELDTIIRSEWALSTDELSIKATVDLHFTALPLIDVSITVDSDGTGFRLDAEFETARQSSVVHAGMPFDVVERSHDDDNLLPMTLDPELTGILMGQREVDHVTEFPFHDFVALHDDDGATAIFAKGIRAYRSSPNGQISIALRRSVEWLARTGLQLRSGDAGPAMYVPGARCERRIEHRLAYLVANGGDADAVIQRANQAFQTPPIIAEVGAAEPEASGIERPTEWSVLHADLPTTSLAVVDGETTVRLFNPTRVTTELPAGVTRCTLRGDVVPDDCGPIRAAEIFTGRIAVTAPVAAASPAPTTTRSRIEPRVGPSRSKPESTRMAELTARIDELAAELEQNEDALNAAADATERYRLRHREYVLDRERLELALSRELNHRLSASESEVSIPDDPDPIIAELGWELNELRVRRRIYDYVVQALDAEST